MRVIGKILSWSTAIAPIAQKTPGFAYTSRFTHRRCDPRLASSVPLDNIGVSRVSLDVFSWISPWKAPARPGLSFQGRLLPFLLPNWSIEGRTGQDGYRIKSASYARKHGGGRFDSVRTMSTLPRRRRPVKNARFEMRIDRKLKRTRRRPQLRMSVASQTWLQSYCATISRSGGSRRPWAHWPSSRSSTGPAVANAAIAASRLSA